MSLFFLNFFDLNCTECQVKFYIENLCFKDRFVFTCLPKTSRSSLELDPGKGDLGVSEVVLQSSKSA